MKNFEKYIHWFLLIGLPVVIGLFVWEYYSLDPALIKAATLAQKEMITKEYSGGWWSFIGYFLVLWFVLAIITIIKLLFSSNYREELLSKIGMIKERDEREVEVTGFASKFSMVASIALLLFLLFFNSINLSLLKYKNNLIGLDGQPKHGRLSLGFGFRLFDSKAIDYVNNDTEKHVEYKELPITKTGIIVLMIFWQVGTFHFSVRRKMKD